ncbi:MAG: type 1 glutamine amidotransferase [Ktedonobacteraceae bacterium]
MKRVLVFQHVWDDPPAYLATILAEHHIICEVVEVEHTPMPALTGYQALLVMGGPQHVYADERHPYMAQEKALLRQAAAAELPTLGICLGGQLLASALGATVRQHHLSEVGFFEIPLTEAGRRDPLFAGLPGYQLAFHWHEDVFELPTDATHLASNEHAPNQAFRYGQHAYGLQFHIELDTQLLHTWLHYPASAQSLQTVLHEPDAPARLEREWTEKATVYQAHTRRMFENFLHMAGLT